MSRIRRLLLLSLGLVILLPGSTLPAAELQLTSGAQQNTLIELFTSQGCSSCPPAERWLGNLQNDPRLWKDLIPVAFHVDYWNYLGWNDPLSSPKYSARQRRYHREGAVSAVYTPGFVVNGKEWRRWRGLNRLPVSDGTSGKLSLSLKNEVVTVRYSPIESSNDDLTLNLAVLGVGLHTVIPRGENAGRTLPQDFVVLRYLQRRASDGRWRLPLPTQQAPEGGRLAIAAWVNNRDRLAPLQAVGGWLTSEER